MTEQIKYILSIHKISAVGIGNFLNYKEHRFNYLNNPLNQII